MKDCTGAMTTNFLFEYVLTRFGYPKVLMSDRGINFLNEMINALTEEFQVYHQKSTPYHPQANGTVEAFDKILENALTKICNSQWNDWDMCVPAVLWAYRTTYKKLTDQTPFWLVYGIEVVMPMEYIVPSLHIVAFKGMENCKALEEQLPRLEELKEDRFLTGFHQQVQKGHEEYWHDHHIKLHTFKVNYLVLLYDSNFTKFPVKFQMHWLGLYMIKCVKEVGFIQLEKLNGELIKGFFNGSKLKHYRSSGPSTQ